MLSNFLITIRENMYVKSGRGRCSDSQNCDLKFWLWRALRSLCLSSLWLPVPTLTIQPEQDAASTSWGNPCSISFYLCLLTVLEFLNILKHQEKRLEGSEAMWGDSLCVPWVSVESVHWDIHPQWWSICSSSVHGFPFEARPANWALLVCTPRALPSYTCQPLWTWHHDWFLVQELPKGSAVHLAGFLTSLSIFTFSFVGHLGEGVAIVVLYLNHHLLGVWGGVVIAVLYLNHHLLGIWGRGVVIVVLYLNQYVQCS